MLARNTSLRIKTRNSRKKSSFDFSKADSGREPNIDETIIVTLKDLALGSLLRDALAFDFGLDLELYSIQYLPCMFHRACPALVSARVQNKLDGLSKHESESRKRALAYGAMEEQLLRARLAYIRTRGDLWTVRQPMPTTLARQNAAQEW